MKGKSIVVVCALALCTIIPTTIHAEELSSTHDKLYSTNMFLSDDVASLQYYIHQTEEQQQKENKAKQEADKKAAQEKKNKENVQAKQSNKDGSNKSENSSSSSTKKSDEPKMVQTGKLRLSNHNDSREEMVRKLNKFWAGHGLAGQGEAAVNAGIRNNIDPYILASISMTESTGGDYNAGSHNAWGRKSSHGGWCNWGSWSEALENEAEYLSHNYLDRGVTSLTSIARIYCPPTYLEWSAEVRQHQQEVRNK